MSIILESQNGCWLLIPAEVSLIWCSTHSSETLWITLSRIWPAWKGFRERSPSSPTPKYNAECHIPHNIWGANCLRHCLRVLYRKWMRVGYALILEQVDHTSPKNHQSLIVAYMIDMWTRKEKKKLSLWRDHKIFNNIYAHWYHF